MKKLTTLLSIFLILVGCQNQEKKTDEQETDNEQQEVASEGGEREPTDDEIREYGLITAIEDSGYPIFAIDVEFPERQTSASFRFNVEASPLDVEKLNALQGKYATFYYSIEEDNTIESIIRDCDPVWGQVNPDSNGISEITGVLSGADRVSGDLPGTLTITAEDGTKVEFEHFIEEEVIAVNNQEVTIFYYQGASQTITYLKPSED